MMELVEEYPSKIAGLLLDNTIDVGLVPVSVIPLLKEHHIITNYCIGCDGPVASVCLFSEVPVEEIEEVLLDYQSRTSVALVKILLKEYWKVAPRFTNADTEFIQQIKGTTAAVVIGDRALEYRSKATYIYDLGEAWKKYTGLPFVFAAWVSNKKLPEEFIMAFNNANKVGVENIDNVVEGISFPHYNLKEYYTRNIRYCLSDEKRKGLDLFLQKL